MAPSAVQPMFILWTMLWIIFQWQRCGVDTVDTVVGVENARLCRRRNLWFWLYSRLCFGFMYQWWWVDFVVVDVEEAWLRRRRSGAATKGGFLVRPVNHRRTALANWFLCPASLFLQEATQSDSKRNVALPPSVILVWLAITHLSSKPSVDIFCLFLSKFFDNFTWSLDSCARAVNYPGQKDPWLPEITDWTPATLTVQFKLKCGATRQIHQHTCKQDNTKKSVGIKCILILSSRMSANKPTSGHLYKFSIFLSVLIYVETK